MTRHFLPVLLVGLTACATSDTPPDAMAIPDTTHPATLSDIRDDSLREDIRQHVRTVLGPDYIVDVDSLTDSSELTASDNGRSLARGVRLPRPDRTFRLIMADTQSGAGCWLVLDNAAPETDVFTLPLNASCRPLLAAPN